MYENTIIIKNLKSILKSNNNDIESSEIKRIKKVIKILEENVVTEKEIKQYTKYVLEISAKYQIGKVYEFNAKANKVVWRIFGFLFLVGLIGMIFQPQKPNVVQNTTTKPKIIVEEIKTPFSNEEIWKLNDVMNEFKYVETEAREVYNTIESMDITSNWLAEWKILKKQVDNLSESFRMQKDFVKSFIEQDAGLTSVNKKYFLEDFKDMCKRMGAFKLDMNIIVTLNKYL